MHYAFIQKKKTIKMDRFSVFENQWHNRKKMQ